ncbi:hypothetical protein F4802DRAFT_553383 [Xylaria palmicola]|nr:hypothetical protein F4802DRAFT_553383 [Xylaria palmicola]
MSSAAPPSNSGSEQSPLKARLDAAAREARQPPNNHEKSNSPNLIKEKVVEYVPGASTLLGTDKNNNNNRERRRPEEEMPPRDLSGPPNRPEHDDHIAEFVRDQHRSKKPDGTLGH